MTSMIRLVANVEIWKDQRGQDLIEYALMGGFVAVIVGAIIPGATESLGTILVKVNSVMVSAAANPLSHI